MKRKVERVTLAFLLLLISVVVSAKEREVKASGENESEKNYSENEQEYDFYDSDDGDSNSGEVIGNYSYSYQDYEKETENFESELDFIPELISQPQTIKAKPGETIQLPCKASDSAAFVRIWKKDDIMLFTGTVQISRDTSMARFKLDPMDNTTLVIHEITQDDSGEYSCRIMVRERDIISLTHRVLIEAATFTVQPVPPDGVITLSEGDNTSLTCFVSGADVPEQSKLLRWTREGVAFPNGNYSISAISYDVVNASKNDSGFYFCTAISEKGETKSAEIEVRVQFVPTVVSIQKSVMRSGRGIMLEFACLVNGEPAPKIVWYKGDEVVTLSSRVVSQRAGNRHLLVVHRVRSDDTGVYMCYATNDLGSSQKTVVFDDMDLINTNLEADKGMKIKSVDVTDLTKKYDQLMSSVAEEKETLLNFQKQCEGDVKSLRNLTLDVINSIKAGSIDSSQLPSQSTNSLDVSIFSDIERLSQEFRQFQSTFGQNVRELTSFKASATDEMERLSENINELQELTNITSRNLEEIFDKDILTLQNFRTTVQHEVGKLRNDFETYLHSAPTVGSHTDHGSSSALLDSSNVQGKVELLEQELSRLKNSVSKLEESQLLNREEMMRVFSDVDGLKKQQQAMEIQQLKIERSIQKLETHDLTDISNKLKSIDRKFEELDEFQESTKKALSEGSSDGDEKYTLIVAEMTKLKNQIFYLQQHVIHLRGSTGLGSPLVSSIPRISITKDELAATIQDLVNEKLASLSKELSACASREGIDKLSQSLSEKEAQMSAELQQVKDKLSLVQEVAKSVETGIQDTNSRVTRNGRRVENLEVSSRKYNLIIAGLGSERRLERHAHLEKVVADFFQNILNLTEIPFDEAERIAEPPGPGEPMPTSKPVRIKFPNVRTKVSVLQASRDLDVSKVLRENGMSIMEDFTPAVKHRRRRLAAFARNRSRAKRLKWALKYDELFFNGRVFIFSDQLNRVVPKPTSTKAKRNLINN